VTEIFILMTLQRPTRTGAETNTLTTKVNARPASTPEQLYRYVRESVVPAGWENATVLYYSAVPNTPFGGAA
jgi:hypothetical protein